MKVTIDSERLEIVYVQIVTCPPDRHDPTVRYRTVGSYIDKMGNLRTMVLDGQRVNT